MSADASAQLRASPPRISRSEAAFWRVTGPLAFGGFCTFALLYSVQPLMPVLAREFSVSPAEASLSLSTTTAVLAFAMLAAGAVSEVFGRKRVMVFSLAASSLAAMLAALAPDWPTLLALRALAGLALSGLPAVAMAYLSDEMDAEAIGLAMGLYIAGSTLGGMSGRLVVAALSDEFGWRPAIAATGAVGLVGAALIGFGLPASRRFSPRWPDFAGLASPLRRHLSDPGLRLLFAEGFLLMGSFVCAYNYIGFRLTTPPFSLSQTAIGFIFVLYLVGAVSSMVMGDLGRPLRAPERAVDRHRDRGGRRRGDAAGQYRRRHRRRRLDHLGILRRPFDRLELGRPEGARRARAGRGALSLLLLRRVEPRRARRAACSTREPAGPASPGCSRR